MHRRYVMYVFIEWCLKRINKTGWSRTTLVRYQCYLLAEGYWLQWCKGISSDDGNVSYIHYMPSHMFTEITWAVYQKWLNFTVQKQYLCLIRWCTPVIPTLSRLRQEVRMLGWAKKHREILFQNFKRGKLQLQFGVTMCP